MPRQRQKYREPYTGDETKTCSRCGEAKLVRDFSLSRRATETQNAVYRSHCKTCSSAAAMQWYRDNPERSIENKRRFHLASAYGLTVAQYNAMLQSQGGVCAICGNGASGKHARDVRLVVDHCHKTGVNRGLLCSRCNRALGLLGDDPVILRKAISYLRRAKEGHQPSL